MYAKIFVSLVLAALLVGVASADFPMTQQSPMSWFDFDQIVWTFPSLPGPTTTLPNDDSPDLTIQPVIDGEIRISAFSSGDSFFIFGHSHTTGILTIYQKNGANEVTVGTITTDPYGLFLAGPYPAGSGFYGVKKGGDKSNLIYAPGNSSVTTPVVIPAEESVKISLYARPLTPHVGQQVFLNGEVLDQNQKPIIQPKVNLVIDEGTGEYVYFDTVRGDYQGGYRFDLSVWEKGSVSLKTQYLDRNNSVAAESAPIRFTIT